MSVIPGVTLHPLLENAPLSASDLVLAGAVGHETATPADSDLSVMYRRILVTANGNLQFQLAGDAAPGLVLAVTSGFTLTGFFKRITSSTTATVIGFF